MESYVEEIDGEESSDLNDSWTMSLINEFLDQEDVGLRNLKMGCSNAMRGMERGYGVVILSFKLCNGFCGVRIFLDRAIVDVLCLYTTFSNKLS